jgi:hypothetical protein
MTFDEILEQVIILLKRQDECRILPSRYGLAWMTNISKLSRRRSSRHSNSPRMKMAESSDD